MKPFYELTQRGRARRIRHLALAALEHYPLEVARLRLLSDGWNHVYRIDTVEGGKYVLRVGFPNLYTPAEVRSEMMWLDALHRDTDMILPAPLRTHTGDLLVRLSVPGVPEPRNCVVFSWVPGKDLADQLTPDTFRLVGELLARLHEHVAGWTPPPAFQVGRNDTIYNPKDPPMLLTPEMQTRMSPRQWQLFSLAVERVAAAQDKLWGRGAPPQVIHYDLHQWNVKIWRGRVHPIDFEDLLWGYPVQDIGLIFRYLQTRPDREAMEQAFRQGYERRLSWPEAYPGEIGLFTVRRILDDANFYAGSQDPQNQAVWPEFAARAEGYLTRLLAA